MNISEELLNYRAKNNLTQKQLSEKLNITETWVNKLESGKFKTSKLMMAKIKMLMKGE